MQHFDLFDIGLQFRLVDLGLAGVEGLLLDLTRIDDSQETLRWYRRLEQCELASELLFLLAESADIHLETWA